MAFKPSDISKQHVLSAVEEIETTGIVLKTGTRWEVIINDKAYPPKEVMRYARKQYDGSYDWPNGGGWPTNQYLEKMGFEIKEKGVNIINLNGHRIYKFSMGVFYKTPKYYKANIVERLEKENLISMHEDTGKSQAEMFKNYLEVGDIVYITYGRDKLGSIARIISDIIELPSDIKKDINNNGYRGRKIEIIAEPNIFNTQDLVNDKRAWLPSGNTTINEILNLQEANNVLFSKYYNVDIRNNSTNTTIEIMNNDFKEKLPLNQILFGPPGTGKTYTTKELAVKIANADFSVDSSLSEGKQREMIINEYNRLYEAGQIVFTTFHQSMSYEDFVEGIKPETLDNDVVYNVQPGLFKLLCEKAGIKSNSNFDEVLERFKNDIVTNQPFTINTGRSKFDVFYRGGLTFRINPHDSTNVNPNYPASIENLLKFYQTESIEGIYNPSYIRGIVNHLYDNYGLIKYNNVAEAPDKNHVLIIDEINRGNVSAIFGELITLLEEDKRLGQPEEVILKLPYSKTDFGVPSNLYIIGTMNTADRSVEALDTALRRRFSFLEVMPKPSLLSPSAMICDLLWKYEDIGWGDEPYKSEETKLFEFLGVSEELLNERRGIWDIMEKEAKKSDTKYFQKFTYTGFNLQKILETINDRVEALLDRDHTIGHSYFLKVNDKASLVHAFKNCIIPLLQEYFYGDYEKINLVLGDGFIFRDKANKVVFAGSNSYSGYAERERYIFAELSEGNIEIAIKQLLNIKDQIPNNEPVAE